MDIDHIEAIGINEQGQLYVKPCPMHFALIGEVQQKFIGVTTWREYSRTAGR